MLKPGGSAAIDLRLLYFFSLRLLCIFGASWTHTGQRSPFSERQGLTCGNTSPGRKVAQDVQEGVQVLFEGVGILKVFANFAH